MLVAFPGIRFSCCVALACSACWLVPPPRPTPPHGITVLSCTWLTSSGVTLPYPNRNFAAEFTFHFLWLLVEPARIFLMTKGNKTEQSGPLVYSLLLTLPVVGYYVYFIAFQTYVLKIDQLLHGVALGFLGMQDLLGLTSSFRFMNAAKYA